MAEDLFTSKDMLNCPICLDLLKDPVAIPCGHSFCLGCIKNCWGQDEQSGVYSCPQCRHTFTLRPVLNKNTMLAELAEGLRKTRLQAAPPAAPLTAAPPADSPAGSGDVECDVCTGPKYKAVKSCLVCLASYCKAHIQTHYESPAFEKHKLVDASLNLREKICSLHDKLMEAFCRTDQQCICLLCVMDGHKGHDAVSAAAAKTEKQKQLGQNRETCKQTIQQKESDVQMLMQVMENLRSSAQAAVEDSEKIFTELIQSIERRRSEVKELIRDWEKTELSRVEGLLKKLEQEIADLRRRDAELEQLSHTEEPIHFLQSFQSLPALPPVTYISNTNTNPQFSIEFVKKLVSEMKQLNGFSKLEINKIQNVHTVHAADPKTGEEFLKYFCKLTLNPSIPHGNLRLFCGNKHMELIEQQSYGTYENYTSYPQNWCQALCTEPLPRRCYWEVEISGNVSIAVSYEDINWKTKGIRSEFGSNNTSWSLECVDSSLYFRDSNGRRNLDTRSSKIGVYVDHRAGILSFYSVSDKKTLLRRVHTTFTQPLYAGFGMKSTRSSVVICDHC